MELTQISTPISGDKAAFLDAFARMGDIALRLGNVISAIDKDVLDIIDSPIGSKLQEPLLHVSGMIQVLQDYQAELKQCSNKAWANQPNDLFPA